jgi:hypothetical protein
VPSPSTSKDYDDLADQYSADARVDESLGGLAFSLGEDALGKGNWGQALESFADGAGYYAAAAYAEAVAAVYGAVANTLRAAGL